MFSCLVAVVIAFIICYAPFHIQRLITSRLDVSRLTLVQQRAIAIFYFISGIFYYIGATVNPIFYHLFSRKYRLACVRTMQRLVHCKQHYRGQPLTIPKRDHFPLAPLHGHPNGTMKPMERIYRSPNRMKTNNEQKKYRNHFTRLSLPAYIPDRIR